MNTCGLLLVIDTKFLTEIMNGDRARATNYVVSGVSWLLMYECYDVYVTINIYLVLFLIYSKMFLVYS